MAKLGGSPHRGCLSKPRTSTKKFRESIKFETRKYGALPMTFIALTVSLWICQKYFQVSMTSDPCKTRYRCTWCMSQQRIFFPVRQRFCSKSLLRPLSHLSQIRYVRISGKPNFDFPLSTASFCNYRSIWNQAAFPWDSGWTWLVFQAWSRSFEGPTNVYYVVYRTLKENAKR